MAVHLPLVLLLLSLSLSPLLLSAQLLSSDPYSNLSYEGGEILTKGMNVHVAFIGDWSSKSTAQETVMAFLTSLDSDKADQSLEPSVRKWWNIMGTYKDSNRTRASTKVTFGQTNSYAIPSIIELNYSVPILVGSVYIETLRLLYSVPEGDNDVTVFLTSNEEVNVSSPCGCGEITGRGAIWIHDTSDCYDDCWPSSRSPPNDRLGDVITYQMSRGLASVAANPRYIWNGQNKNGWVISRTGLFVGIGQACSANNSTLSHDSWNIYGNDRQKFLVDPLVDMETKACALQREDANKGGISIVVIVIVVVGGVLLFLGLVSVIIFCIFYRRRKARALALETAMGVPATFMKGNATNAQNAANRPDVP